MGMFLHNDEYVRPSTVQDQEWAKARFIEIKKNSKEEEIEGVRMVFSEKESTLALFLEGIYGCYTFRDKDDAVLKKRILQKFKATVESIGGW